MMENRTPKSVASTTSTVRGHSLYCEATGPIVHEGFVAARVRAIQGKSDGFHQNLSHSPLIPCPVPRWLQITDHITPPQSLSTGRRKSSHRGPAKTRSPSMPLPLWKPKLSSNITTMAHGDTNIAAQNSSFGALAKEEKAISGPNPKLPIMGLPYDGWPYSFHDEEYRTSSVDSGNSLRRINGDTDKLVSLVDRGWVGCDVFGKSYRDRPFSDILPSSEPVQEAVASESHPEWENLHEEASPVRRCQNSEVYRDVHNEDRPSCFSDFHLCQKRNLGDVPCNHRRDPDFKTRIEPDSKADARTGSSKTDRGQHSDMESERSFNEIQAKIRKEPPHFTDCKGQAPSEFEKLSLSQEIDRHLSQWESTRVMDQEHSPLVEINPTTLREDDRAHTPPVGFNGEDHHQTTTNNQDLKDSSMRSASWFSKLAGLRLVLIDKAPIMQALSRRTSEPTIGSVGVQHQYVRQHGMERQAAAPGNGTEEASTEVLLSKVKPNYLIPGGGEVKTHSESVAGDDKVTDLWATEKPVNVSGFKSNQDMPSSTNPPSQASPAVPAPLSPTRDVEKNVSGMYSDEKLPGFSFSARHGKEKSILSSHNESVSNESRKIRSVSSNIEPMTKASIAQSHDTQSSEAIFPRLKPAVITHTSDKPPKDMKKSAQWEVLGNGRGIKRVQVIVSLDGSDDLVIDAKLLAPPTKDAEPRIEDAENLESEQGSDYLSQGFS